MFSEYAERNKKTRKKLSHLTKNPDDFKGKALIKKQKRVITGIHWPRKKTL